MRFLISALLLTQLSTAFAEDVGNGIDGACDLSGSADTQITAARRSYQCTTLFLDQNSTAFKGVGGAPLIIKVQGDVRMLAGVTLDLSGDNGVAGTTGAIGDTSVARAGGLGGAGGYSGGSSPSPAVNGTNGGGPGGGEFGDYVAIATFASAYGGGGGGGSYKNRGGVESLDGNDGDNDVLNSRGPNGPIPAGNESSFETTFAGGSGGGAGGGAESSSDYYTGSSGGGGGGAIRIISGEDI